MNQDIDPREVGRLRDARARVLDRIGEACDRVGRDASSVTLVAVSKTVPPDRVRAGVAAGLDLLGENRVQEAETKVPLVPGARWHLIGPLQSNKARRAVRVFDAIESVGSVELAGRLDRVVREERALPGDGLVEPGKRLRILLEVNVDRDPAKAGLPPSELEAAVEAIAALGALELAGLMTIGRAVERAEEARHTFSALRDLSERLRSRGIPLGPELSMGMTDDYPVAVEEGATIVRVGRALFGERP
ncbi:MAG TPA: YggS family pyridoxal phosphate-dependent enzyme [Candidatus Dormibacteraeota bacterium]|nr:YggS family pyridoxal phosphate-dependent enzyme [Candidatus Dormibacteraeota bacterium]